MPLLSTFGAASARSFGGIGAAAAGATLDIDEAFSTYLYEGTGSAQTITNGVDLSGEGGLVWIKNRDTANGHNLEDTERGAGKSIYSNTTDEQYNLTGTSGLSSFNSNGFSITGSQGRTNTNGDSYAAWTFRKAPKFFDIVTYTGNGDGTGRAISHNLGSAPGMILIKRLSSATNWIVYHRSEGGTKYLELDNSSVANTYNMFDNTDPTSTQFYVSGYHKVNQNGETFVAYLFAHNNSDGEFGPDSDQDIIKCGDFQTSPSGAASVNLGFEPQWLIVKAVNDEYNWEMYDVMRGWGRPGLSNLKANTSAAEADAVGERAFTPTSTGFYTSNYWGNNVRMIYMAIRRGPLAEPESATNVFAIDTQVNQDPPKFDSGFVVDFEMTRNVSSTADFAVGSRLIQGKQLNTNNENAETSNPANAFDFMDGWNGETSSTNSNVYSWMWKRAPGYFDVVCYDGSGSNRTISHNLGVAPEMIWVKSRSNSGHGWMTYHTGTGATHYMMVNSTAAAVDLDVIWNDTAPTSSVFSVGTGGSVNDSGKTYIAYLFATLAGISKVGSYTGNGTSQNIDCGFSGNARFVLIKNASESDNWMVYDSVRGINSGTEGYLRLNTSAAEYTSGDHIDPYSGGFAPTSNDPSTNRTGNTYIFYAIA